MRVLHVDSARGWRGGQNQVLLTARGMASRGHDVAIACQKDSVLEARARAAGIATHALSFRGDLGPGAALGLRRLVGSYRPEVLHVHDPHAAAAGAFAAGLRSQVRLVASRRVDFEVRGAFSRLKYDWARGILAVSNAIRSVLVRSGFAEAKIRVVYEGVPDRPPEPGGDAILESLGVPRGSPVVGNVAQLTDHKDHSTLLAAIPRVLEGVPNAYFVVVGEGELRPALESQARSLGITERLRFAGFRMDLDQLLPAFTLFCLSSKLEGLGTSLLDAMGFARPIVATTAGGIPEAVLDGVTGRLSVPGDAEALAEHLVQVLRDPGLQESLGRAGRRRFLETFTADRMVEKTLEAYQSLP